MTMKTKRTLAIGGGTVVCAALTILIATQFKPAPEAVTASVPSESSEPVISVEISTARHEKTEPIEIPKPETIPATEPDNSEQNNAPVDIDPEKEAADFIEDGGIEIEQNFPEPERKPESAPTDNTPQTDNTAPPEPPKIEDEEMLTNPYTEPTYEPAQTTVTQPEKSDNPNINPAMHGQKKDGMIFINGFGWIVDEGGGGIGEPAPDMYENGNKIGYFG